MATEQQINQALTLLEKELTKANRIYTMFNQPNDHLTAAAKFKLAEILEQEEQLNVKLKAKGWIEWGVSFLKENKDYKELSEIKTQLDQKKQKLLAEYIEETRQLSTMILIDAISKDITEIHTNQIEQVLQQPIIEQLKLLETKIEPIAINDESATLAIETAKQQDLNYSEHKEKIIEQYRTMLANQTGIINVDGLSELAVKYPNEIKQLKANFEQAYANFLFSKIQLLAPTSSEEAHKLPQKDIKDLKQEKDLALKKLILICTYSKDPKYFKDVLGKETNITEIIRDINLFTKQELLDLTIKAEQILKNIPGSYMLSSESQQKFIEKIFIIQAKIIKLKKTTIELKPELDKLKEAIIKETEQNVNNYSDIYNHFMNNPGSALHPLMTWNTNNPEEHQLNHIQQSRKFALDTFDNIPGKNLLSKEEKIYFINKLSVLKEKEMVDQENQWLGGLYFFAASEASSINGAILEINKIIHEKFKQDANKDINTYQQHYEISSIKPAGLSKKLQEQLADAIVNMKKANQKIPPLQDTPTDKNEVIERIAIAKSLGNLTGFQDLPTETQLKNICELQKVLQEIKTLNEQLLQAKEHGKDTDQSATIRAINTNLENNQQRIKKLIDDIMFFSIKNNAKELLKLDENFSEDTIAALWNKVKIFFKHPTTQGVLTGAALGATAGIAATATTSGFLGTIPVIGPFISSATATITGIPTILATTITGAVIGYKFPAIRHVFTPIKVLSKEISSIFTKPNSKYGYIDRICRGLFTLAVPTAAMVGIALGTGLFVAAIANPFSGPVIAGVFIGGLATIALTAGAAKLANIVSRKISKTIFKTEDIDFYTPTLTAINRLGGNENATIVSNYFKNKKQAILQEIKAHGNNNDTAGIALQEKLKLFDNTWSQIQKGDVSAWNFLSRAIFKEELAKHEQQSQQLDIAKITDDLLKIVDISKSSKDLIADTNQSIVSHSGIAKQSVSFDTSLQQHNNVTENLTKNFAALMEVNNIIKLRSM